VPGLTWSVAETAAHLVAELQLQKEFVSGERDPHHYFGPVAAEKIPAELSAAANARMLDEFTERDPQRLADLMIAAAGDFAAAAATRSPDDAILTGEGLFMTVPVMTAALLGEQLIHGFDISRAMRARWPIPRDEALLVLDGVMAMVPEYVNREQTAGLHLAYELRFRGGARYRLTVDDSTATVTAPGGRVDCWIAADPVAFLLVGYGRVGELGQIARGKIIAGGRKPWLGLKFSEILTNV
jgi:uncharacterized protein (TIGR03083 family)